MYFVPPEDADERELIVVDCNNPDVGKRLQKEMAELLTMQGASEEKMIGFAASEKARLSKAWYAASQPASVPARLTAHLDALLGLLPCELSRLRHLPMPLVTQHTPRCATNPTAAWRYQRHRW